MEKYLPLILMGAVFLVATVGLTLSFSEDSTANVVVERSCKSLPVFANTPGNIVNCVDAVKGGCPAPYPVWKQYNFEIQGIQTCCCVRPKSDYQDASRGKSLYQG